MPESVSVVASFQIQDCTLHLFSSPINPLEQESRMLFKTNASSPPPLPQFSSDKHCINLCFKTTLITVVDEYNEIVISYTVVL